MNRSKKLMFHGLLISGLLTGGLLATATTANASSYSSKRNNSVKLVWRHPMNKATYKAKSTKGYLYSKHLGRKYKSLKSYPKTKWVVNGHEKLTVKKTNKSKIYYHVKSTNGKHQGWVWRGYLKKVVTKNSTKTTSKKTTTTTTNKNEGQFIDDSSNTSSKKEAFNASAVNQELLVLINKERENYGRKLLDSPVSLNTIAGIRSKQIVTNYNHTDASGNIISWELAKQYLKGVTSVSENISITDQGNTNKKTAEIIMDNYFNNDQASNGAHRGEILSEINNHVGLGVYEKDGQVYNAMDFY